MVFLLILEKERKKWSIKYEGIEEEDVILYRVQVGAYSKKENAEVMLQKVKEAGLPGVIL